MGRPKLNLILMALAVVGIIATVDIVAHKDTPHFWVKLVSVLALSAACLYATRDRESWDIFFTILAALSAMGAMATTTTVRTWPGWWLFFLGFTGAAMIFLLLTRNKRETLIGIGLIVGFRLLIFAILYGLHH